MIHWRKSACLSVDQIAYIAFRGSTVGDVYRKVMGDAPLAYAETVGGVKVAEDDLVAVAKNDVSRETEEPPILSVKVQLC